MGFRAVVFVVLSFFIVNSGASAGCLHKLGELNALAKIFRQEPARAPFRGQGSVPVLSHPDILIHNPELAPLIQEASIRGLSPAILSALKAKLLEKGVFNIPVSSNGALIASGVDPQRGEGGGNGGMGTAVWGRDLVRAIRGAKALKDFPKAQSMVMHLLQAMSTDAQLGRIFNHLRNPGLHIEQGSGSMPRVRWDGNTLDDVMQLNPGTSKPEIVLWNHFQFDFHVAALRTIMLAFDSGLIRPGDLSDRQKAYVLSMAALPLRLSFWQMRTSDAWEESNAVRTSTIIQEATFYWLFQKGRKGDQRYSNFVQWIYQTLNTPNEFISAELKGIIHDTLREEKVAEGLRSALEVIEKQIPLGEAPLSFDGQAQSKRDQDAALLHALWYENIQLIAKGESFMDWEDLTTIFDKVRSLIGPAGISRYHQDAYIFPFFWYDQGPVPEKFTLIPALGADLKAAFWKKDGAKLEAIFGKNYMAQWTIHDALFASLYGDMYTQQNNPIYRDLATYHFLRAIGQITGTRDPSQDVLAADGEMNKSWQLPEAYIPYRIFENGTVKYEFYLPCPHSPLYWSVAELARAFEVMERIYK